MPVHLYLSMMPEALIASMLPPEEFGVYYATGTEKHSRSQAVFMEIDPTFRSDYFRVDEGIQRCKPEPDGSPKRSIYISVYRVLENIPLSAIRKLYLVTQDGQVLGVCNDPNIPENGERFFLYQEIAPVHPLIVSLLPPRAFHDLIVRNPISLISVPAICFVDLRLGELSMDPVNGAVRDLPYANIEHLRACLVDLGNKTVHTKMVNRNQPASFLYRTVRTGIYVGNHSNLLYYPLPSPETLRAEHYRWWRSANM